MSSPRLSRSLAASPFFDPLAVEAWDAWFRWRDESGVRDLTVDHTWRRVATALAAVETQERDAYRERFMDALGNLRVLPDEYILATAGTSRTVISAPTPGAVINLVPLVRAPFTPRAHIDRVGFDVAITLAVRMLDNWLAIRGPSTSPALLHIGVIGFADALCMLGQAYSSPAALVEARFLAQRLAQSALAASVALAAERGADPVASELHYALAERRRVPQALRDALARHGIRHGTLTGITPRPKLAMLLNNVADTLDPLSGEHHTQAIMSGTTLRVFHTAGCALTLAKRWSVIPAAWEELSQISPRAQIEMRQAWQPNLDAPLNYPLRLASALPPHQLAHLEREARTGGLPPLTIEYIDRALKPITVPCHAR